MFEGVDVRQATRHQLPPARNPVLVRHAQERAQSVENRASDRITAFAGSMTFVYIHIAWFGCWIGFGVEDYPFGLLTMIVSLEAIFLSTFVMISQNRADAREASGFDRGPAMADRPGGGEAERGTARSSTHTQSRPPSLADRPRERRHGRCPDGETPG